MSRTEALSRRGGRLPAAFQPGHLRLRSAEPLGELGAGQPAVAAHFPQPDTEQLPVR